MLVPQQIARRKTFQVSVAALPPALAARLSMSAGQPLDIVFRWNKGERKICRKKRRTLTSEWAAKNRRLDSKESSRAGKWRNEETPWLIGPMDALCFPSVREVYICKAPQWGGSESLNNFVGRCIDLEPGNVLLVYPDEKDTTKNIKRIQSMIQNSLRLREYLTGAKNDESKYLINLTHMTIRAGWPRSTQSLASTHERYVVLEEVDKPGYDTGAKEASPLDLARKRAITYGGREKIILNSSPSVESGNIWQALLQAQVVFEYVARCPHCLGFQVMRFDQIKWPKKEDIAPDLAQLEYIEKIENERLAWYECERCSNKWDDFTRDRAVAMGHWQAKQDDGKGLELMTYLERRRPKKIAFHGPVWTSKVFLASTAAAFLKGKKNSGLVDWRDKLKDFANAHCAEPWLEYEQTREEIKILALCDDRPRGVVPGGNVVAVLLGIADTQDDGWWYEIRAMGYGMEQESWLIREGFTDDKETLEKIFFADVYTDPSGKEYRVSCAAIDTQGHRAAEVYDLCRQWRHRLLPLKGEQRMCQPYSPTNLEYYPNSKKPIPGGLQLWRLDTNFYKNIVAAKLEIHPADPGAIHFHAEFSELWAKMYCVEYVDEKGLWQCPDGKANHAWDLIVYFFWLADKMGIRFMPRPVSKQRPEPPPAVSVPSISQFSHFERPSWLDRN